MLPLAAGTAALSPQLHAPLSACSGVLMYGLVIEAQFSVRVNVVYGKCRVMLGRRLSQEFHVQRGVKQGSVLSTALFLLVMDPLLRQLQASGLGLSISKFYAGGFLHADDVRTLATSRASLEAQATMVEKFAE